ncbi:MAG: acyl-ACP--UDP-N-acetylglucosamine O-acyltransferase [Opitutales bacterium]|jgi:UDP-N-acetylglucosamine acyltransferase
MIHPSAIVEQGADVAPDANVGPYAVIESGATVASGCEVAAHAIIRSGTTLEEGVKVDSFAVIGGLPQDLHFDPATRTGVLVGRNTLIREHVTIHRATKAGQNTRVGSNCLLMATCHVAHDCALGDGVILANAVLMGGHVTIGNGAFIGGNAAIHQNVRVGERAMLSMVSRISMDVPPFCMMAERDRLAGLNIVGLRRAGFSREEISEIKRHFHTIYDADGSPRDHAAAIPEEDITCDAARRFIDFFKDGKRGFAHRGKAATED